MKHPSHFVRKAVFTLLLGAAVCASAQDGHGGPPPMSDGGAGTGFPGGPRMGNRHPGGGPPSMGMGRGMRGGLQVGPPGRWWDDPQFARDIGIQPDQKARMDAIFEANRGTLMVLFRNLRTEESGLAPLIAAEQPDENRILAQIERVAQARAELEKATARMLLGIRRELTLDQWHKLEAHRGDARMSMPPPGPSPNDR